MAQDFVCSLINRGKTTLYGISRIEEVYRVIEVMESISKSNLDWKTKEIIPPKNLNENLNKEVAIQTRSIIMFADP